MCTSAPPGMPIPRTVSADNPARFRGPYRSPTPSVSASQAQPHLRTAKHRRGLQVRLIPLPRPGPSYPAYGSPLVDAIVAQSLLARFTCTPPRVKLWGTRTCSPFPPAATHTLWHPHTAQESAPGQGRPRQWPGLSGGGGFKAP